MPRYRQQQQSFRANPRAQLPDMRGMDEMSFSEAINMSQQTQLDDMQMRGMQRDEWRDESQFEQERENHEWMRLNADLSRKLVSEFDPTDPDLDAKMMQMDSRIYGVPGVKEQLATLGRARDAHNRKLARENLYAHRRNELEYKHAKEHFDSATAIAFNTAKEAGDHEAAMALWAEGEKQRENREKEAFDHKRQESADRAALARERFEYGITKSEVDRYDRKMTRLKSSLASLEKESRSVGDDEESPILAIEKLKKEIEKFKLQDPRTRDGSKPTKKTKIPNSIMESAAQ